MGKGRRGIKYLLKSNLREVIIINQSMPRKDYMLLARIVQELV